MDINRLCMGCMREKQPGESVCRACGFSLNAYQPAQYVLPALTILQGKYLIGKELGEGGFGITYLAYDLVLEHPVAIKEYYVRSVMYRDHRTTSRVSVTSGGGQQENIYKSNREKFTQEAKTLAKLEHLNGIVRVYDYFEENGTAYIVMEYLSGQTLKEYVKFCGGKLSWNAALSILRPVMESMHSLHERGIIHRDISPDNMMFSEGGTLKLLDFGGAKTDVAQGGDQRSMVIMTKKGYSPPEQVISGRKQGAWTDEYAMAATWYYCLCGTIPRDSMERLAGEAMVPMRQYGADVTPQREQVILKGLSLQTEDRYPTMREFLRALERSDGTGTYRAPGTVEPQVVSSGTGGSSVSAPRVSRSGNSGSGTSMPGAAASGISRPGSSVSGGSVPGVSNSGVSASGSQAFSTSAARGNVQGTINVDTSGGSKKGSGVRTSGTGGSDVQKGSQAGTGAGGYSSSAAQPPKKKKSGAKGFFLTLLFAAAVYLISDFAGYNLVGLLKGGSANGSSAKTQEAKLIRMKKYSAGGAVQDITEYTYNSAGNLVSAETKSTSGTLLASVNYEYWANGELRHSDRFSTDSDGETSTSASSYRSDGTLEKWESTYSSGAKFVTLYDTEEIQRKQTYTWTDGTVQVTTYQKKTDSSGNLTTLTGYQESGELNSVQTYTYRADGTMETEIYDSYYTNYDGQTVLSWETKYWYDSHERISRYEEYESDDNTLALYAYTECVNEYGSNDRIRVSEKQSFNADGTKQTNEWSYSKTEYSYDGAGNLSRRDEYETEGVLSAYYVYEYE